jgi:dTDP-4-amino-4,6-dideoxygalactose transaminase
LPYLDQENAHRHEIAQMYNRLLADTGLLLPICISDVAHAYHQYVICDPRRDILQSHLREQSIGTLIHYPQAVHQQPAYVGRVGDSSQLLNSEQVAARVLSLPMYPELSDTQVIHVANAIRRWCEHV